MAIVFAECSGFEVAISAAIAKALNRRLVAPLLVVRDGRQLADMGDAANGGSANPVYTLSQPVGRGEDLIGLLIESR